MSQPPSDPSNPMPMQGEGDYIGGRRYQEAQTAFAKSGKVDKKAHEAEAALEGPEAAELETARRETAKGEPKGAKKTS